MYKKGLPSHRLFKRFEERVVTGDVELCCAETGRNRCPGGIRGRSGTMEQARIAAREVVSLESSGSFGHNCDLKSDNWEIL